MRLSIILLFLSIIGRAQVPVLADINLDQRDAHELLSEFDFQDLNYVYDSYPAGDKMIMKLIPTNSHTLWLLVEYVFDGDKMISCKETIPVEHFEAYRDTYGTPIEEYEQGEAKYRVYNHPESTVTIRLALSDRYFTVEHHPK